MTRTPARSRPVRARILLGAAIACGLLAPAVAAGHGLVQRANLPIPEWLFAWAAAVVLIVSFVALALLWREPLLERDRWRPLPGALGRLLGSAVLEAICGAIGVLLLVTVIVSGLAGVQTPFANFAPSDEANSTFECKLDKKDFKSCDSPYKKKVKVGKHKFKVRAIDPAGNVDPSPARYSWKVVKKERKKA